MKFFQDYKIYTEETEPPKNFHVWSGIATISALLGKRCYIPQGFFTVHPNLYIVLVGPAGVKKSSAMNISKGLLRSLEDFPLAPASTTREALLKCLQDNKVEYNYEGRTASYHQASAFVTELQEFIGGKHINAGMIGVMTALWDEPTFEYVTANKEPVIINSPYFTLLACCTKDWVTTKLQGDVISDGFARRVVFVLEEERSDFAPWPTMTSVKNDAYLRMSKEVARINTVTGKFRFTNKAREYWDILYRKIQKSVDEKDAYVQNYYSTKHVLLLKVCMCLSAASGSHKVVDVALLKLVEELFENTERNLLDVFEGLGRNELSSYATQVLNYIQERWENGNQDTTFGDISLKYSRDLSFDEVREILNTLNVSKQIEMWNAGTEAYRPKVKRNRADKKNMFDSLIEYRFDPAEACDESPDSEIERMVDAKSLREIRSSEQRVKDLMGGTLARAEDLKKVDLDKVDKKKKRRK